MNCHACGGRLEGHLVTCPFCGARQEVDFRQIHFRNLGQNQQLPCPRCDSTLEVLQLEGSPPIEIERCPSCSGAFFNPGELESLLHQATTHVVWVDRARLDALAATHPYDHVVEYLRCPICRERMSHLNFGGKSGVILDRCGTHGLWLEPGQLHRLREWWHAGGKHLHQADQAEQLQKLRRSVATSGPVEPPAREFKFPDTTGPLDGRTLTWFGLEALFSLIASVWD